MTTSPPPGNAVVRVSRANFDPARFSYFAGASPDGSMVHVSVWQSDEHAGQMARLKEMIVDARNDAEKAGVTFIPIVNYPIDWAI